MQVILTNKADKALKKILIGNQVMGIRIEDFLKVVLPAAKDPKVLPNALKMTNRANTYRWRIGSYRIVGDIFDDELLIEVIDIDSRGNIY